MKKLNARETIILLLTLLLGGFFITYQWVIKPMHERSGDINDQLRVDQDRLNKARQMVAQKSMVEARYQSLVNLIGVVDSEEAQMPTIVSKIEAAARDTNIHIANIQPQKSATQKEARFLAVELEIDGQWLDIVHFLYLLQQQPNLYFINELNLEMYSDATSSLRGRIVVSRMCLVNP
jgi:Tfp pilus assembly protein PilO